MNTYDSTKHLEMIQAVINRLAQNSFAYKGWCITVVAALFALAAKDTNKYYLLLPLLPTISFWGLDAFYLRQERLFRKLYDAIRSTDEPLEDGPYTMNTKPFTRKVTPWIGVCFSKSIVWLYGPLLAVILTAIFLSRSWEPPAKPLQPTTAVIHPQPTVRSYQP
ncbi:MAG: hypothetical protein ACYDBB_13475 [Armatimonadota bacterium]